MAIYGWDASHYDGPLNRTILGRAAAEGITFFTHKVAEGLSDTEGTMDDTALAAARDAAIQFIGGYLVPRTNATAAAQVTRWIQMADSGEPWWRTFPGWFWQVDLERWSYDNVPASVGIDCARRLRDATGKTVILYASHSQYGDSLAGWDGPIWNADYVGRSAAGFAAMYPGDGWTPNHGTWTGGWAPYSGKTPTILQYTSSATIAGLTTCDANAYRGGVEDFARLIGGDDMQLDGRQAEQISNADVYGWRIASMADQIEGLLSNGTKVVVPNLLGQAVKRLVSAADEDKVRDTALAAAVNALAVGSGIDPDALYARVDAAVAGAVKPLQDKLDAAEARILKLAQALAAAGGALDAADD